MYGAKSKCCRQSHQMHNRNPVKSNPYRRKYENDVCCGLRALLSAVLLCSVLRASACLRATTDKFMHRDGFKKITNVSCSRVHH